MCTDQTYILSSSGVWGICGFICNQDFNSGIFATVKGQDGWICHKPSVREVLA